MNAIHAIRKRLGLTQSDLANGIGVTQSNVSNYENGQTVTPRVAKRVIAFAATRGVALTFDDVYAATPTQPAEAPHA